MPKIILEPDATEGIVFGEPDKDDDFKRADEGVYTIDVRVPGGGEWPSGAIAILKWKDPEEDPVIFTDTDITFTAIGTRRIYIPRGAEFRLDTDIIGIRAYLWSLVEKVIDPRVR